MINIINKVKKNKIYFCLAPVKNSYIAVIVAATSEKEAAAKFYRELRSCDDDNILNATKYDIVKERIACVPVEDITGNVFKIIK